MTRELASSPAGDEDFDWRISVADVTAAGAFSLFPGVDRTIVLLDGPELILTVGDAVHALTRHEPFDFDGGLPSAGSVPAGPTRDLNVMARRGRCRATVVVAQLEPSSELRLAGRPSQLVIALAGPVAVAHDDGRVTLHRFDLYQAPPGAGFALTGDGPVVFVEIHEVR